MRAELRVGNSGSGNKLAYTEIVLIEDEEELELAFVRNRGKKAVGKAIREAREELHKLLLQLDAMENETLD